MLWLFTFAMLAQDPVNSTVTVESSMELETVVRDGKGESTRRLTLNRKEKFKQTKVDAKTVRIEVLTSLLQKSGSDTPIEEKATPLAGQTYVSTRTENGWVAADADGGSPPTEGRNLGAWNSLSSLLPASGDPKSGDKWVVESKDVMAILFPTSLREGTGLAWERRLLLFCVHRIYAEAVWTGNWREFFRCTAGEHGWNAATTEATSTPPVARPLPMICCPNSRSTTSFQYVVAAGSSPAIAIATMVFE
jgi:hypothetical protein